jgi:MYXO-CTERM domain-containing protein
VAHVLTARAAGGRPLPRWFDEGLAMIAGGTWGADDHARFLLELMVEPGVPLARLDSRFAGTQRQVAGAYAVAGTFVRDLVQRSGAGAPGRILAAVAAGTPFPAAFQAGAGTTLGAAEADFWRRHSLQRWLPLATSSTTLWLGITLLALLAARRRRRRDAALRALWEEEDGANAAPGGPENAAGEHIDS